LSSFTYSNIFAIVLIAIGVLGIAFFLLPGLIRLMKKNTTVGSPDSTAHRKEGSEIDASPGTSAPTFSSVQKPSGLSTDLFRALLIVLALVVAAGFMLILLPGNVVDRVTDNLRARYALPRQDMIALLYLGDEITEGSFRIRGVIRNITTSPIEHLDAVIRLYSPDGKLLETVIVRTDRETISPDEIAYLELSYPDYRIEFGKYAVEFKLRNGETVLYKDMRTSGKRQEP
jgi:hypothetical protein